MILGPGVKTKGFTLIELLVVISIIGMLSSIVLTSVNSARAKAQGASKMIQFDQLRKAMELYYADNGSYPNTGFDPHDAETMRNALVDDRCGGGFLLSYSKASSDTVVIPGLVPKYISELPNKRHKQLDECSGYFYISNGKDYKYLELNTYEGPIPLDSKLLDPMYPDSNVLPEMIMSIRSPGVDQLDETEKNFWDFIHATSQ